mgnify:CR=1 FL=1
MRNAMRWLGYTLLAITLLMLSPFILLLAAYERVQLWRTGVRPTYFIPEHPASAQRWAEQMEHARRLQAHEESE